MCELLVRVRDKPLTGNPVVDSQRTRRGDVIAATPNGWGWSHAERANPEWIILQVPGMPLEEGLALATPEPRADQRKTRSAPRRVTHKRMFRLNLDVIVGPDTGRRDVEVLRLTANDVRANSSRKESFPDSDVIG